MLNSSTRIAAEITPEAARAALSSVLSSRTFLSSPRLARFLRYVVEQTIVENTAGLKEYSLGLEVFDRGPDFDPRTDAVVRVEARQLRFKLTDYYAGPGANDDIVISLPKGGYTPRLELREAASPSERLVAPAEPESAIEAVNSSWWPYALALAVLLVMVGGWWWKAGNNLAPADQSIAVLPFTSLSANPASQYFSDGLTDEITGELSRIANLRVVARASAFQFRGRTADLREIGRQLHVSTVLEGSVERFGDRVKIVAQLERVADGSHLWANTYERQASDLFAVQSELAGAIASSFRKTLPAVPASTRDELAHDHYMRGVFELEKGSPAGVVAAQADFQKAIERDPAYAIAYAGLGTALYNLGAAHLSNKWTDYEGAERMWRKALELEPSLEQAHSGLALLYLQYKWDWSAAEREVRAALASGPSARAELRYATILTFQRRSAEAEQHLLRSEEIDPVGPAMLLGRGQTWIYLGNFTRARAELQKALDRHPEMAQAQFGLARLDVQEGHMDLALEQIDKLAPTDAATIGRAWILALQGRREVATRTRSPVEAKTSQQVPNIAFAAFYAAMGDTNDTLKWLERAADGHEWAVLAIGIEPWYKSMRDHPRFKALESRIGLP